MILRKNKKEVVYSYKVHPMRQKISSAELTGIRCEGREALVQEGVRNPLAFMGPLQRPEECFGHRGV
jgi:hypothetical protein